jgi:hypothetical protein
LPFERAQVVVFGGRSKPPISPDDMLDTPPSRLRLGLQPCLSLLDVDYAVDDSSSRCGRVIPKAAKRRKRVRLPKYEKVYLAVHRHDNLVYYKRLDPEAFVILTALSRRVTGQLAGDCARL